MIITQKEDKVPIIILKKGKTEIRIENPAAILKKINEMYPQKYSWHHSRRILADQEFFQEQRNWCKAAPFNSCFVLPLL